MLCEKETDFDIRPDFSEFVGYYEKSDIDFIVDDVFVYE